MTTPRILLVEDELHLAQGLLFNLKREGFEVVHAEDGLMALELFESQSFDVVVLDLMLPKLDGPAVLKRIRKATEEIPVLILSAKGHVNDRISTYQLGADDYLVKPFHLEELFMKIRALLKRTRLPPGVKSSDSTLPQETQLGSGRIDWNTLLVTGLNKEIQLTDLEGKLLQFFFKNEGRVLSREEILTQCWGMNPQTKSRTVDNFIVRLRKYFEEDPKNPRYFQGVRNRGYLFQSAAL